MLGVHFRILKKRLLLVGFSDLGFLVYLVPESLRMKGILKGYGAHITFRDS